VGISATSVAVEGVLSALKAQLPHTSISCSLDLVAAKDADHQLLITSRGSATRQELSSLRQQLELQARPVTGWLLLEGSEGDAS
jgi:hypothetical protein